jgi:hypothetical protein
MNTKKVGIIILLGFTIILGIIGRIEYNEALLEDCLSHTEFTDTECDSCYNAIYNN